MLDQAKDALKDANDALDGKKDILDEKKTAQSDAEGELKSANEALTEIKMPKNKPMTQLAKQIKQ